MQFDFARLLKYVLEGLAVSVCAFVLPKRRTDLNEVVLLGLVASVTFALIDTFASSMSSSVRQGTGFGLGFGLAGLNTSALTNTVSSALPGLTGGAKDNMGDTDTDSVE